MRTVLKLGHMTSKCVHSAGDHVVVNKQLCETSMESVCCPVCGKGFPKAAITYHVNNCLNVSHDDQQPKDQSVAVDEETCSPARKQRRMCGPSSAENKKSRMIQASQTSGSEKSSAGWGFMKKGNSQESPVNPSIQESCSVPVVSLQAKTEISTNYLGPGPKISQSKSTATSSKSTCISNRTEGDTISGSFSTTVSLDVASHKSNQIDLPKLGKPLAEHMRPQTLHDYVGQEQVLGKNKMLRTLLDTNQVPSMILWGPPGCGKTTLAKVVAEGCRTKQQYKFVKLSATTSGIADVKEVIKIAKNDFKMFKKRTILFVDEIHRFNKLQQDTFLPHVEDGTVTLIGATTENPSFQVNNALLSRCRVIVLEKLTSDQIKTILQRAIKLLGIAICTKDNIQQTGTVQVEDTALEALSQLCDGDARAGLNGLQIAIEAKSGVPRMHDGMDNNNVPRVVNAEDIKESLQKSHIKYDRAGEEHYNCASALQKSIRGSDDNAALYWLGRMLEGGEDPLFIARRLLVTASEDIGLAEPQALVQGVATLQACQMLGMPECAIPLAQCTTYLARAPKSSESYAALKEVREQIKNHQGPLPGVPLHLRNAPTKLMKNLGYGKGYQYNPSYSGQVKQEYLPSELKGMDFFHKETD